MLEKLYLSPFPVAVVAITAAISLASTVSVSIGDTVESDGLTLTFVEVPRDSRCPKGLQCFVAGEAHVVFEVSAGDEPETITFEVPPGGTDEHAFGAYTLVVEELEPEAVDGRTIEPSDYVATVRLSKN